MDIKLYGYWRSSSAYRVRIALGLKNIAYEDIPVNLVENAQLSEEYKKLSPMGHVPCLVVDGEPFVESVAICGLLDALVPEPALFPNDPYARARVTALVEIINSGIQPVQNLVVLRKLNEAERAPWAASFIERGLRSFEALLEGYSQKHEPGPFSFGAAPTAADVFLMPQLYNAKRFGVSLESFPRIVAARQACLELSAFADALPEKQKDAPQET